MSNDDHKKAPQSPEEMLEMVGKREDMIAGEGSGGEAEGEETIAREESPSVKEVSGEEREELAREMHGKMLRGIDEDELERALDSCREVLNSHTNTMLWGAQVSPPDPLDTRNLRPSGFRTPEENDRVKEIARKGDQGFDAKIAGELDPETGTAPVSVDVPPQIVSRYTYEDKDGEVKSVNIDTTRQTASHNPEPDPDVMGYLHSAFDRKPDYEIQEVRPIDIRSHTGVKYSVKLDTMIISFTPCSVDEWVFEISTKKSWRGVISFHDSLEACVDKAKTEAKKALANDLDRLTDTP